MSPWHSSKTSLRTTCSSYYKKVYSNTHKSLRHQPVVLFDEADVVLVLGAEITSQTKHKELSTKIASSRSLLEQKSTFLVQPKSDQP